MKLINRLSAISHSVRLLICDLWGVMHNGVSAHSAAIQAIEFARKNGITTVFLSNAPRPRGHVRSALIDMGVPQELTDNIVTSGGLARDAVREKYHQAKLYHLGPKDDHNTIDGLPVEVCTNIQNADIILATGLDFPDVEQHRSLLEIAHQNNIPFLCTNPDRIVHVGSKLFTCAGAVADLYEDIGGTVEWYGKPMKTALNACLKECGMNEHSIEPDEILMVGDSLQTDIAGACSAGFRSLFIAGGIHREEWPLVVERAKGDTLSTDHFKSIFGIGKPVPHYATEMFSW